MARILIVGGGCRGRSFACDMLAAGHAVRITTRDERGRSAIEEAGAECWVGTPSRLESLRGSLDGVTIACWMLALARGTSEEVSALHSSRLEFFLGQSIDTTVRGFVYDASLPRAGGAGDGPTREDLDGGAALVRSLTTLNAIPAAVLGGGESRRDAFGGGGSGARNGGLDDGAWLAEAAGAVETLLGGG